jgi:SAM-dependent methyltransferase
MNYHKNLDETLFVPFNGDKLFRDGLKSYEVDGRRFIHAIKILGNPTGKRIVEIGTYPGTGLYYFGEYNQMLGFGKSSQEFTRQVEMCGHHLVEIDIEANDIPFQYCGYADILLMQEVLEHIRHPKKCLNNIVQILMVGGKMLITTNNASYIGYILKLLVSKSILDSIETENSFYPGHTRYYHLEELCKILENMGLKVIHKANVNYLPPARYYKRKFFGYLKNILIKFMPLQYSTHIEIIAQKI